MSEKFIVLSRPGESIGSTHVLVRRDELDELLNARSQLRADLAVLNERLTFLELQFTELQQSEVEEVRLVAHDAPVTKEPPVSDAVADQTIVGGLPTDSIYRGVSRTVGYDEEFQKQLKHFRRSNAPVVELVIKCVQGIAMDAVTGGMQIHELTPPSLAARYSKTDLVLSARASKKIRVVFVPNGTVLRFADILEKGKLRHTKER